MDKGLVSFFPTQQLNDIRKTVQILPRPPRRSDSFHVAYLFRKHIKECQLKVKFHGFNTVISDTMTWRVGDLTVSR